MSIRKRLNHSLFRTEGVPKEPERSDKCKYEDELIEITDSDRRSFDQYVDEVLPNVYDSKSTIIAGTMNIHPLCHIDGKKWKSYTEKEQCEKLCQLMTKYLIGTNYLVDDENYYVEKCPVKGSIHTHFIMKDLLGQGADKAEEYFNACCKFKKYKTFKFEEIYDIGGWKKYIKKAIHTPV